MSEGYNKHREQARALLDSGRLKEARVAYHRLVKRDARDAQSWFLLGAVHGQLGEIVQLIECCLRAVALSPAHLEAHYNLGQAYLRLEQTELAMASYRRVLELNPGYERASINLGMLLRKAGRIEEAAACYVALLACIPGSVDGQFNLGNIRLAQARFRQAATHFQLVLQTRPDHVDACVGYAAALLNLLEFNTAQGILEPAVRQHPDNALLWASLGRALQGQYSFDQAITAFQRALQIDPGLSIARNYLGTVHWEAGDITAAVSDWQISLEQDPNQPVTHSHVVFAQNYREADSAIVAEAHRNWNQSYAGSVTEFHGHANLRESERRLRIGYVSPDLQLHSVAYFIAPLLKHHSRDAFHITCYSNARASDHITDRLRSMSDEWRDIMPLSDDAAAALIQQDDIDILVDLAGHTSGNRLLTFARKPAPVQITWLGYPNTTGLPTMDYRLTDSWADPPGTTEDLHSETLLRIPAGFLCYSTLDETPPPAPLPALTNGYITFGSFNNYNKITPELIGLWANLLRMLPDSRLVIKNITLHYPAAAQRFSKLFEAQGIDPNRVELSGYVFGANEHLTSYNRIDIALDSSPYNGTTTSCEALWMGVPVLTLAGRVHAGRVGVSILTQLRLDGWIATDQEDYVRRGVLFARNMDALSTLRAGLRARMQASSLCDGPGFARRIESVYREAWRRWCTGA